MIMTMCAAAIALGTSVQAAPPPLAPDDIVVMAERMRRFRLVTRIDRKTGVRKCVFKRRSGDAEFDTLMCDALLACAKTSTTRPQMEACLTPRVDAYARDLAARRAPAR